MCGGDDLGEVEVDALDVGVLGGDHAEGGAVVAADIDEHIDPGEAVVVAEQLLDHDAGVAQHPLVEHLAEPCIGAHVLERRHAVGGLHRVNTAQHRFLYVVPASKIFN